MTAATAEAHGLPATPQLAALDLEVLVRQVLEASFGWIALGTILEALPREQRNAAAVEKLLFVLETRGVIRLTARPGRSILVCFVREGYEPTATVLPDPPPKAKPRAIKYFHTSGSATPLPAAAGRRFRPIQPAPTPENTVMSDDTAATILKIIAAGPIRIGDLAKRVKLSGATCRYHLVRLAKDGKVAQTDASNRMSAWQLVGAKAAAAPEAATPRNGHKRPIPTTARKGSIHDLELKLQTLEALAEAAKADGRSISAFILGEVRADLERLAA